MIDYPDTFKENSHYDKIYIACKNKKYSLNLCQFLNLTQVCICYTFKGNPTDFFCFFFGTFCPSYMFKV